LTSGLPVGQRAQASAHRGTGLFGFLRGYVEPGNLAGDRASWGLVNGGASGSTGPETIAIARHDRRGRGAACFVRIHPQIRIDSRDNRFDVVCRVCSLGIEGFVDGRIAIVIDAVTNFGASSGKRGAVGLYCAACRGRPTITREGARGPASAVTRCGQTVVAGARLSEIRDVFIQNAVAIVIERVARLVIGRTAAAAHACGECAGPAPAHTRDRHAGRAFRSRCAGADAADLHGRWGSHAFIDGAIAVVIDPVASFGWRNVRTGVFAFLVVVQVIITWLATLENAHSGGARPIRVDRAGITIVTARPAIGDVRLQIGLVRQLTVAIGIHTARIGRAGWSNRTIALNDATRAALGSSLAGTRGPHGRRSRDVAWAGGISGRHTGRRIDCAVAIVIDTIACFCRRINCPDADD